MSTNIQTNPTSLSDDFKEKYLNPISKKISSELKAEGDVTHAAQIYSLKHGTIRFETDGEILSNYTSKAHFISLVVATAAALKDAEAISFTTPAYKVNTNDELLLEAANTTIPGEARAWVHARWDTLASCPYAIEVIPTLVLSHNNTFELVGEVERTTEASAAIKQDTFTVSQLTREIDKKELFIEAFELMQSCTTAEARTLADPTSDKTPLEATLEILKDRFCVDFPKELKKIFRKTRSGVLAGQTKHIALKSH